LAYYLQKNGKVPVNNNIYFTKDESVTGTKLLIGTQLESGASKFEEENKSKHPGAERNKKPVKKEEKLLRY